MTYLSLLLNRKLQEAEAYRKQQIPSKLVKFISLGSFCTDKLANEMKFKTLEEQKLWLSQAKLLNDPYELQCMYIDRAQLQGCPDGHAVIEHFECLLDIQKETSALASLSGNGFDCLPMWAHYTNNYQGFCVEYDVLKPDAVYKVGYEPQRIPIAKIAANLYAETVIMRESGQITSAIFEYYALLVRQQLFLKHTSWQYENEYRIMYPFEGITATNDRGRNVALADSGLKTSRIVAGFRCSAEHIKRLANISKQLGCGDVTIAKINKDKYTLLEGINHEQAKI